MLFIAPKQMLMFITVMFLGVVSLTRLCPVCLVKPAGGLILCSYCAAHSCFVPKFICGKCHEFDLLGAILAKRTWKLQLKSEEHWKNPS